MASNKQKLEVIMNFPDTLSYKAYANLLDTIEPDLLIIINDIKNVKGDALAHYPSVDLIMHYIKLALNELRIAISLSKNKEKSSEVHIRSILNHISNFHEYVSQSIDAFDSHVKSNDTVTNQDSSITANVEVDEEARKEFIKTYQRRLNILHSTQAKYGINCPPEVIIDIEDIEKKLESLRNAN